MAKAVDGPVPKKSTLPARYAGFVKSGGRGFTVPLIAVALFAAVVLSVIVLTVIKKQINHKVEESLQAVLQTTGKNMDNWITERLRDINEWTMSKEVKDLAAAQLDLYQKNSNEPQLADILRSSPHLEGLRRFFHPRLYEHQYNGIFIISPDSINIASMRDENIGQVNLLSNYARGNLIRDLFRGQRRITLPMISDVPLKTEEGGMLKNAPTMFTAAPIYGEGLDEIIAVLTVRIDPDRGYSHITEFGRIGRTGETYAFDSRGTLITESRFDETLRRFGLIEQGKRGILNIQVRDPGKDLTKGTGTPGHEHGSELTRLAEEVLHSQPGLADPLPILEPYRDYRGVRVVGVGFWNSEIGFGMVTEMDVQESFASFAIIRWVVIAVLGFAITVFLIMSLRIDNLRLKALDSNPLSRLPGNRAVTDAINRAINMQRGLAVVYCDLDHFKAYNDHYGFALGDRVIQFTGNTIIAIFQELEPEYGFVGHIGGDDFMFIVDAEAVTAITGGIGQQFDHGIKAFYSEEDLAKRSITAKDRKGIMQEFPIMTLSMAGVDLRKQAFAHHLELSERCVDIKKKAKALTGSVLFLDRRIDEAK